jgi:hypothetical protein
MGRRLFPPPIAKHDERLGFRIDQGWWFKDGRFVIEVQKNSRPHGDALAATVVNPKMDTGEDAVGRLRDDAKMKGNL